MFNAGDVSEFLNDRSQYLRGDNTMTIKEMAAKLGTSVPTLYRKVKDAGIDIKGLRDAEGRLTPAGITTIASLFDGSQGPLSASQGVLGGPSQTVSDNTSRYVSDDTAMMVEVEVLRAKLEGMETTVEMLRAELDRLRAEAEGLKAERDRLLTMLETEQRQRVQLLTDGNARRGGLFAWLRRGRGE